MYKTLNTISLPELTINSQADYTAFNYSDILRYYAVKYEPSIFYWQILSETKQTQGWELYLSVIRIQIPHLLKIIVPELIKHSVSFKIIQDYETAGTMLDGGLGHINIGKMVSVFPKDNQQAVYLAKKLILLTTNFRGPVIPESFYLGARVYTAYNPTPPNHLENKKAPLTDVIWPFQEIAIPQVPKKGKLLNNMYFPLHVLKSDAKGDVVKGIYFKKIWQIKRCLIKQGRLNMFVDDTGRDIQDRLQWQKKIYHKLKNDIPFPAIFDYFRQNEDGYLVMEYIKGRSLGSYINSVYKYRSWRDLSTRSKLRLLELLMKLLSIIRRLHEKGYIHRDITPENFLIDRKEKIFLIDMELSWCADSGQPNPPFRLGTPGFMSSEQYMTLTPTQREDIYALGALMIVFFTNLSPLKLNTELPEQLKQQLLFFIGDNKIVSLIASCLEPIPDHRPELEVIQKEIEKFHEKVQKEGDLVYSTQNIQEVSEELIKSTIQAAIYGLSFPMYGDPKHRWASRIQRTESNIQNEQVATALYEGWHTGMSGPLWLIAICKSLGFSVDASQIAYHSSWQYINERYFNCEPPEKRGLYLGGPGIALAITEGLNSGLLLPTVEVKRQLLQCFSMPMSQSSLAWGWAGEGVALLQCASWMDKQDNQNLLVKCVEKIINSQLADGYWNTSENSIEIGVTSLGLNNGVSGIIWFLLLYMECTMDKKVEISIQKGLSWLIKKINKKSSIYKGFAGTRKETIDNWSFGNEKMGILLILIKAYKIFKDQKYKKIVEDSLQKLPSHAVVMDFTLESGLAGLGELYMEAFQAFSNSIWKERYDWIVQVFLYSFQKVDQGGYWFAHPGNLVTADLFYGNSGIIHFLLRSLNMDNIRHPLDSGRKVRSVT